MKIKPASLLVVALVKALSGIPPSWCGRQMATQMATDAWQLLSELVISLSRDRRISTQQNIEKTLSNILNDKHIPQKMQKPICQRQEKRQKRVLRSLSDERSFLSCAALRMLVKICLTKQKKSKSYQMTNMQKVLVSNNDLIW